MKILVIANPISGGRRGSRRVERLVRALEDRGHAATLFWTRGAGDAGRRVRELEAGLDRVVVAGGDGTLNEVVNGLADPSAIPLAQLPMGTANLLAHEFALPRRPDAVAELVERGRVRWLDLGRADGRRFLAVASCGFDAMVTREVRRGRSGRLGYRGYLGPILRTLRHYRPPHLEIVIDGAPAIPGALAVVCNVSNYGGLFTVVEDAAPDSGVLHVCVFATASIHQLLRYALAGLRRRISRLPGVSQHTGRRIEIRSPEPVAVQLDGDPCGQTPVTLDVIPGAVPFLAPPAARRER